MPGDDITISGNGQIWNDEDHPWQSTGLPWKDQTMPWNDVDLPWKAGGPTEPHVIIDGLDTGGLITTDETPTITGSYVDPTGGSVSGVTIHILLDGVEDGTATTDVNGDFTYTFATMVAGTYTITAEAASPSSISAPFAFTVSATGSGIAATAALLLCA